MERKYEHKFRVNAPIQDVAELHRDPQALKKLTPPPIFVQFNKMQPLGEDSIADFTMWIGPFPVHWQAVHSDVDELQGFTDKQIIGPFKYWVHHHEFRPLDTKTTEVIDEIKAELSDQALWGVVGRFMWLNLPILFAYRAFRTRRELEWKVNE